jgi:hypothetical protein
MVNKCEIADPECVFYYCHKAADDEKCKEGLGVDIRDYELEGCDTLWIKSYRPKPNRPIGYPPNDFTPDDFESKSLQLGFTWAMERLLKPDDLLSSGDPDTVWYDLDIRDLDWSQKASTIQYLFILCDSLREAKIPGFEGGCLF